MNIDLLFTEQGEAGLIANENFARKIAGVVFDTASGIFTLEFADMDFMDFNIPVEPEYNQYLDLNTVIHIGSVKDGHIGQAYQVPLMFSDDPYRNEIMKPEQPAHPLAAFQYFMKQCVIGQPAHRDDLEDEDSMGCILGSASPSSLEFAPHLARRHGLEIRPAAQPSINAPGMGLGGGSSAGGSGGGSHSSGRSESSRSGRGDHKK
tara:strand:+ start:1045 stop:1662 length:618 start_codon:yes stop_codon:yes gene_type:complete